MFKGSVREYVAEFVRAARVGASPPPCVCCEISKQAAGVLVGSPRAVVLADKALAYARALRPHVDALKRAGDALAACLVEQHCVDLETESAELRSKRGLADMLYQALPVVLVGHTQWN